MNKNSEVVKTKNKKGGCLKIAIIVLLVCVMLCGSVLIYNRCTKEERELKYAKANILQNTEIKIPDEAVLLFYDSDKSFIHGRQRMFAVFEFKQEPTQWLEENKFLRSDDETNPEDENGLTVDENEWYFLGTFDQIKEWGIIPSEYYPNLEISYLWLNKKRAMHFFYYPDTLQLIVYISAT